MYSTLFGGIEAFSTEHFQRINGFSNQFFGWGGEDDNLYDRLPAYIFSLLIMTSLSVDSVGGHVSFCALVHCVSKNVTLFIFVITPSGVDQF